MIITENNCVSQHQQKNVYRTNSHDHVRKLVEQEGRAARNLVTWSVPVTDPEEDGEIFFVLFKCFVSVLEVTAAGQTKNVTVNGKTYFNAYPLNAL